MKRNCVFMVLFLVVFGLTFRIASAGVVQFTKHTIDPGFVGANCAIAGDIDGDGDTDILGGAYSGNEIAWWQNEGSGIFTKYVIDSSMSLVEWVHIEDLDSDGDMDVLGAAVSSDDIAWYENDGSENFIKHMIDADFDGARFVYTVDLDGDGDKDVLGAAKDAQVIAWYENDGSENFTKHVVDLNFASAVSVYACDLDDDGDIDLLGAAATDDDIAWYENDGSENFTKNIVDGSFDGVEFVCGSDIDGDGNMDVLGAAALANEIAWWKNDGSENFTKNIVDGSFEGANSIFAMDIDRDGDTDILGTATAANGIAWWENTSSDGTSWSKHSLDTSFTNAMSVIAADIDGDGCEDILGAAQGIDTVAWWENKTIRQAAKLTASDPGPDDGFGQAVSVEGNVAIIGALRDDDAGIESGSAYVFENLDGVWTETVKLTPSDSEAGDHFGISVRATSDSAIVGAYKADSDCGAVYIFQNNEGAWQQTEKLTASDATATDYFGVSLSANGNTLVVGAYGEDGYTGSVYVFEKIGETWTEQAKLMADDGAAGDEFGAYVAVYDDTIIVSSFRDDDAGNQSGSVYVFEYIGDTWQQTDKLTASDAAAEDRFGRSVAFDGQTLMIGTNAADIGGMIDAGSAYVFEKIDGTWTEISKLTASDASAGDNFGYVAIENRIAIIGAYLDDGLAIDSGSAYVFKKIGDSWVEQMELKADDAAAGDGLGICASTDGVTAIIGAYLDDDGGVDSGSAYIFDLRSPTPNVAITSVVENPDKTITVNFQLESHDPAPAGGYAIDLLAMKTTLTCEDTAEMPDTAFDDVTSYTIGNLIMQPEGGQGTLVWDVKGMPDGTLRTKYYVANVSILFRLKATPID